MIKELVIKNFQSHPGSILHFDKGVNVIIGSSDSGKTAILRAIKWVVTNRPSGDEFRSKWGGETEVTIAIGEPDKIVMGDKVIARLKTDKENAYRIDDKELKAFGQDVPEEIQIALNLNEVNIQEQLDSPFLLSSSPGEVAQHFNKIANLEQIDLSLKKVQGFIKQIETDIKATQNNIHFCSGELKLQPDFHSLEKRIVALEELEKEILTKSTQCRTLESLLEEIVSAKEDLESIAGLLAIETEVKTILTLFEKQEQLMINQRKIATVLANIETLEENLAKLEKLLLTENTVNRITNKYNELDQLASKQSTLSDKIRQTKSLQNQMKINEEALKTASKHFATFFPDICPLCDTPKSMIHEHVQ